MLNAMTPVQLPASKLCTAATDHARRVSTPALFNHVMRSFWFADAVGRQRGAAYDGDLLYVACVLHDLGLTGLVPGESRFEVEGADAARRFLAECGMPARELDIVWDAIALHTTATIPQRKCAEIALCQLGIAIDVGIVPAAVVPEAERAAALAAFPRAGFEQALLGSLTGLHARGPSAAAESPVVAEVCERLVPGYRRVHFCDVLHAADFAEQ